MHSPDPTEAKVTEWLKEREGEMIQLLRRLVDKDSPSLDKAAVDRVSGTIGDFLSGQGIDCETRHLTTSGNALRARIGDGTNAHLILLGHCDTVFPSGEAARRPFEIREARAYGPGVADMKGGLVVNAFVIAALRNCATVDRPIVALFTSDEEITSPASRPVIEHETRGAFAAFNAEPGRANGNVVRARKGGMFLRLDVHGKAAHSGANFQDGISAIEELSRKILALHALTDLDAGITVNVGIVSGGQTINTVAPHAYCEFDVRYATAAHRKTLLEQISRIADTQGAVGLTAELTQSGEFLPLEETPASRSLLAAYRTVASDFGETVEGEFSGGCSDAGLACQQGVPTLCGLGPVGGLSHTVDEYIEISSLVRRAQMLALTVLRVSRLKGDRLT